MRVPRKSSILVLALGLPLLAACSGSAALRFQRPASAPAPVAEDSRGHAHGKLGIPPGHLPAPGQCRIWIPGVPPGKQSPPGDCADLASRVPRGAWLVTRSAKDKGRFVEVREYHTKKPGFVVEIRVYNASTGAFVSWGK